MNNEKMFDSMVDTIHDAMLMLAMDVCSVARLTGATSAILILVPLNRGEETLAAVDVMSKCVKSYLPDLDILVAGVGVAYDEVSTYRYDWLLTVRHENNTVNINRQKSAYIDYLLSCISDTTLAS